VIFSAPKEKALGPDGFIGLFFSRCWDTIKEDIIRALHQFYLHNQQGLHFLNQALVVLIPKKENPQRVSDFRPISLTHSFSKIISKLLANRLSPELDNIISVNQSAFIQKRCIHDNFVYVQEVIKDLHKRKIPALFLKPDISKAFDTVNWPYLLEIMKHLGFGQGWRNWISSLWNTASSTFLLNGEPGKRLLHCSGVRQGDPLSPMLFLIAIKPLHKLIAKAQDMGLLDKLSKACDTFRMSLYADDAALFIGPSEKDFRIISEILNIFAAASGLCTNHHKTEIYPISCDSSAITHLQSSGIIIASFPCMYLGLPLHYRKPTKEMMHSLIQKIADRLPGWKRRFFSYPGRELLVKSVLSSMATYFLTVHKHKLQKWAIARVDRFRRSFLWKGHHSDNISGGHCLVNWETCLRPKRWGGLGIKDLNKFSRALRLRWSWHQWDHKEKPWKHLLRVTDSKDRQLFFASTTMQVGNGRNTPFWESKWLHDGAPKDLAPNLFKIARFKKRSVHTELKNSNWIRNVPCNVFITQHK
jgi:hypothetical protein